MVKLTESMDEMKKMINMKDRVSGLDKIGMVDPTNPNTKKPLSFVKSFFKFDSDPNNDKEENFKRL